MKKLVYSLVLLLVGAGFCVAQPGYRGKKLSVQGSLLFLPALTNATYGKEPGWLSFNTTGQATMDYVVGKRNSIGLFYQSARTSNVTNYRDEGISAEKVATQSLGMYYRIYRKKFGNIAPLGKYCQLGAGVMFNDVKQEGGISTPFQTYALKFGMGRNKILFDRLILSYGWEFAYTFTPEGMAGATYFYKDDAQSMAQYRLFRHSLLNLKVGLGFLAH